MALPNVYYFKPFSYSGNLGAAYNQYFELLNDSDWACLVDADVAFLTPDFGKHIAETLHEYPDTGILTCLTNRVNKAAQCYQGQVSEDPNIKNHRIIAQRLQQKRRGQVRRIKHDISGHIMVIQKDVWRHIGGFKQKGILGVDTDFSKKVLKAGLPIRCLLGLYVFHYYRLNEGGYQYKKHLK